MSEKAPLSNPPDDKAVGDAVQAAAIDLVADANAAKAIADAKKAEAKAAKKVAEAIEAEAQAAAKIAQQKAIAAGLEEAPSPTTAETPTSETESDAEVAVESEQATIDASATKVGPISKLLETFQESLLPQPNYAPGEEVKQVIHMAPYRATVPKLLALLGLLLLLTSIGSFAYTTMLGVARETSEELARRISNIELMMWISLIAALLAFIQALRTGLSYKQWQFIMTDKRTIITTPDPDQGLFADSIYLKDGTIKVLDTNFSKNAIWIPFQIFTGARDVMLSTGAYAFMENGAKVKDGIRFPDVTAEDTKKLEALVFSGKK